MTRRALREAGRRLRRDPWRRRLLVAWLSLAAAEWVLFGTDMTRASPAQWGVELVGLAALGVLHASLAPDDWRGSAFWPAALCGWVTALRIAAEAMALAFDLLLPLLPVLALGLGVVAWAVTRWLDPWLWRRVPAVALGVLAPLGLRLLILDPSQTLDLVRPAPPDATADGPPVVVISVDTLRSDHAPGMASWQLLARRGATWPRAVAGSSWTWPSLVTLWSGLPADRHGSGRKATFEQTLVEWGDDLSLLPEELADAGYATAAFVTNPVLAMMPLAEAFGHWRHGNVVGVPLVLAGFPGESSDAGDARRVVDAALAWLETAPPRGFLLWVHLFDPHLPYRHAEAGWLDYDLLRNLGSGEWFVGEAERATVRRGYAREVAHADRQVMRLLRALEARGVLDDGVVVFSSDHGEELFDHGAFEHGHSHHGEVIDVPLALVAPGLAPGERGGVAALEDVAPTLRAILGLPAAGLDLRDPIPAGRTAVAFGNLYHRHAWSLRTGETRAIVEADGIRVYDLARDPAERDPERLSPEAFARRFGRPARLDAGGAGAREFALDERGLRALGYLR